MATRYWAWCGICGDLSRYKTKSEAQDECDQHAKNKMAAHEPGHIGVPREVEVSDDTDD